MQHITKEEALPILEKIAPYFRCAIRAGLKKEDAVFWAFWVDTEVKRLLTTDDRFLREFSDSVWHEANDLDFDRSWILARSEAWRKHVILGEPRPC